MIFSVLKDKAPMFHTRLREAEIPFQRVRGPFKDESSVDVMNDDLKKAFHIWIRFVSRRRPPCVGGPKNKK